MPAYRDILSDTDIWAVISFIESTWSADVRERQERMNHQNQYVSPAGYGDQRKKPCRFPKTVRYADGTMRRTGGLGTPAVRFRLSVPGSLSGL